MRIILKEKVGSLGILGDLVNVRPGYARNFLIPYGKAAQATKVNIENFKAQKTELEKAEKARLETAAATAEVIKCKEYIITAQAGEGGKLFGSVGAIDIARAISETTGKKIEKNQIRMPERVIRVTGEFEIMVDMYTDLRVAVKINVVAAY